MTTLILVPTELELEFIAPRLMPTIRRMGGAMEICGFGPIAAAGRTAQLLAALHPKQVILLGIAGSIANRLDVATAHRFDEVACFGIGCGSGDTYLGAADLGWSQWAKPSESMVPSVESPIGDTIALTGTQLQEIPSGGQLLTCCSTSARKDEVQHKLRAFPTAVAEDMEGYAVALACSLAGVEVDIIRGISNQAGNREKGHWQIAKALEAASDLVLTGIS